MFGGPFDIVGKSGLPDGWIREHVEVNEKPVRMETANGEILADETIGMGLEAIGEQEIRPYVLQDSPDLISIGRRCQEMGYTFHWSPWSKRPYFILPGSEQKVHLQTMGCAGTGEAHTGGSQMPEATQVLGSDP